VDASLHTALINAALGAGVASVIVALINRQTNKKANEIAANKLALEIETAERDQGRKDREALRAELKECYSRNDALEATIDRLRAERDEAREQGNAVREALALRVYNCRLCGEPCQMEKSPGENGTKPVPPTAPPSTPPKETP
jgi:rubrerythrin